MKTKIYVLTEPDGGKIRYVGKTVNSLARRLGSHLYTARRGDQNHLYNWLRTILQSGCLPIISLIGEVSGNGSAEERAWIKWGRDEGWRLVNSTSGGEGLLNPSTETRRKLSESHKDKPNGCLGTHRSEESKLKMSLAKKGKPSPRRGCVLSQETRQRISQSQINNPRRGNKNHFYGKHHSEKTIQTLREATQKRLIQNGHPFLGKHHSKEAKQKMSAARKGKLSSRPGYKHSPATLCKMSESHRGKKLSPESILKRTVTFRANILKRKEGKI